MTPKPEAIRDLLHEIRQALPTPDSPEGRGIDHQGIAREIIETYGLVHLDAVPGDAWSALVARHDHAGA